jgi:hypothetical protein
MKTIILSAVAALAASSVAAQENFFFPTITVRPQAQAAAARIPQRPMPSLGNVNLTEQFDRNLHVLNKVLGSRSYEIGLTADAGAKTRFFTFTSAAGTVLGKIGSLDDLRGKGVDVRIDANTSYNFRVEVGDIFDDPIHKSIVHITPIAGTNGPTHEFTTGVLLDAVKAKSSLFSIDGEPYWVFYGRDAKTDGSGFANTRSFLFTHEAGMSTKAWPVAESALPLNQATTVALGDVNVSMTRTATELIINSSDSGSGLTAASRCRPGRPVCDPAPR